MGQDEVLEYLKKTGNKQTRKQIADAIGENPEKISHIIKDLLKWGDIKCEELSRDDALEFVDYILVRRTRFYFV